VDEGPAHRPDAHAPPLRVEELTKVERDAASDDRGAVARPPIAYRSTTRRRDPFLEGGPAVDVDTVNRHLPLTSLRWVDRRTNCAIHH
jgi:hypothetical protein